MRRCPAVDAASLSPMRISNKAGPQRRAKRRRVTRVVNWAEESKMTANIQDVIRAFGSPQVPAAITQKPFDYDASRYLRLCRSDTKPEPADLYRYAEDLLYQNIQRDLFLFLLPRCLTAWQNDLMASHRSEYAGFVEQFSAALAKHSGFRELILPRGYSAVSDFMLHSVLDKIDQEHDLAFSGMHATPYSWIYTIGTFGTAFPAIANLWKEWWSCRTVGRSCGVLQYASVLLYPDDSNPIFSPWTRDAGGGAPVPWETDGHIFNESWLQENVDFLRSTLTSRYVRDGISAAAKTLRGETDSPIPELMVSDFDSRTAFLELRVVELIQNLSLPLGEVRQWITT